MIEPKFLSPLRIERRDDGTWMLASVLRYQSAVLRALLVVPEGFCTDLSSVPRLPFVYLFFGDRAYASAVLHDFLYGCHLCTKDEADAVFQEAMEVEGHSGARRWFMWAGVHVGGRSSYESGPSRFRRLGNESGAAALLPLVTT